MGTTAMVVTIAAIIVVVAVAIVIVAIIIVIVIVAKIVVLACLRASYFVSLCLVVLARSLHEPFIIIVLGLLRVFVGSGLLAVLVLERGRASHLGIGTGAQPLGNAGT